MTNRTAATSETVSIGLTATEGEALRAKADASHLSASKWVGALAVRHVGDDDTVKGWVATVRARREPRRHRTSTILRSADMDVIRAAARRCGTSPHAWLQAVAIMGTETTAAHAPASRPAVPASLAALDLVCATLAVFLAKPEAASTLAAQLRKQGGLEPEHRLTAADIRRIAEARATASQPEGPRPANVVELRPAREPRLMEPATVPVVAAADVGRFTVTGGVVYDVAGNMARIKTFDSVDAAKAALQSCTGCVDCVDCVDCHDCMLCTSCGQCRDCRECVGCICQVGLVGARNITVAS